MQLICLPYYQLIIDGGHSTLALRFEDDHEFECVEVASDVLEYFLNLLFACDAQNFLCSAAHRCGHFCLGGFDACIFLDIKASSSELREMIFGLRTIVCRIPEDIELRYTLRRSWNLSDLIETLTDRCFNIMAVHLLGLFHYCHIYLI